MNGDKTIGDLVSLTPHKLAMCILLRSYLDTRLQPLAVLLMNEVRGAEDVKEKTLPQLLDALRTANISESISRGLVATVRAGLVPCAKLPFAMLNVIFFALQSAAGSVLRR